MHSCTASSAADPVRPFVSAVRPHLRKLCWSSIVLMLRKPMRTWQRSCLCHTGVGGSTPPRRKAVNNVYLLDVVVVVTSEEDRILSNMSRSVLPRRAHVLSFKDQLSHLFSCLALPCVPVCASLSIVSCSLAHDAERLTAKPRVFKLHLRIILLPPTSSSPPLSSPPARATPSPSPPAPSRLLPPAARP